MAGREGPAADDGFMPFEPRRHRIASALETPPTTAPLGGRVESQVDDDAIGNGEEAEPFASDATSPGVSSAQAGATDIAAIKTSMDQQASLAPEMREPQQPAAAAISQCDHALAIRSEAIRLASIACGRALRHAVVLHPRTIAGFVDDALAAAGNPRHARIWLHPDAGTQRDMDHEQIWDAKLEPGDVIVEHEDVMLRADLERRSALLVRAAADR